MAAWDGQTLWSQDGDTIAMFQAVWGDNAADQWENEHNDELRRQGWSGPGQSGGGGGGSSSGGGGSSSGGGGGGNQLISPLAVNAALQEAQQEYLRQRLELEQDQFKFMSGMEKDKLAFEKAKEKFYEKFQTAQLTGEYNGNPTWQKQYQEAGLTGYYNGNPTLAREQGQDQTMLGLLGLGAQLRGPRNAFKFAELLNGVPQGMQDILGAAAGRYVLPGSGGGSTTTRPEAVNVYNLVQDLLAGRQAGAANPYQPLTVSPAGAQAPAQAYNYEPTGTGNYTLYPPGVSAPPGASQVSATAPLSPADAAQAGNYAAETPSGQIPSGSTGAGGTGVTVNVGGAVPMPSFMDGPTNTTRAASAPAEPLMLNPNQWNAKNVNRLNPYAKDLLLAQYEDKGWDPDAAWAAFQQSLPRYGGPATGRVAMAA